MSIKIQVRDKVATNLTPEEVIVCGNSGYAVELSFDDEWSSETAKTARFVYRKGGKNYFIDVLFTGNVVEVPMLSNINYVLVGVYAGDLITTTPARISCVKSILCGTPVHEDPPEDVYNQLMELLSIKINCPQTAQVGQTIVVKSVDSNGKPTEWETANLPVIAYFSGLDGDPLTCSNYTAQQIEDMICMGNIVFAHVSYYEEQGQAYETEIFKIGFSAREGCTIIGSNLMDVGWKHYGKVSEQYVDGNPSNKTAGNEIWNMI